MWTMVPLFLSNSYRFYCNSYTLYRMGCVAGAAGNGLRVILLLCPYYHHNVHATGRIRYADTRYSALRFIIVGNFIDIDRSDRRRLIPALFVAVALAVTSLLFALQNTLN